MNVDREHSHFCFVGVRTNSVVGALFSVVCEPTCSSRFVAVQCSQVAAHNPVRGRGKSYVLMHLFRAGDIPLINDMIASAILMSPMVSQLVRCANLTSC